MKTGDKRSTCKSSCRSRGGISTRSFERTATRYPMQAIIFTFCEFEIPLKTFRSCDRSRQSCRKVLKIFEKTRRHEGIVPLVAPEQGACLPWCKDASCSK
jgi:hypothetical protein